MTQKIFFIGVGNMGGAILKGLLQAKKSPQDILFFEPNDLTAKEYESFGALRVSSFAEGINEAETAFICVKPQIFNTVVSSWKKDLQQVSKKVFISIMAGIPSTTLKNELGSHEVLRVMPNLPLTVGKGAIALSADFVSEETLVLAESIFKNVGNTVRVQESWMDAVTGLSGSGPAYVFEFIEGLIMGGVKMGLTRAAAKELVLATLEGSLELLKQSSKEPQALTAMVSSPGGTTIAGLQVLEEKAFRGLLMRTVEAATLRSKELG